jgi:hypothetical protein
MDPAITDALAAAEKEKLEIELEIAKASENLSQAELRSAVAKRLLEKITNFAKDFKAFQTSLEEDATNLELTVADLAKLTLKTEEIQKLRDEAVALIQTPDFGQPDRQCH